MRSPTLLIRNWGLMDKMMKVYHFYDAFIHPSSPLKKLSPQHLGDSLYQTLIELGAKTAVLESDYIDIDYSSTYYLQLARSFTPIPRNTDRMHFFSCELQDNFLEMLSVEQFKQLGDCYLGYTVVRPGPHATLGRTFIRTPDRINDQPVFFPTATSCDAYLAGMKLTANACPYITQDGVGMVCATASLWMACTSLSRKINGVAEYTSVEITSLAVSLDQPFGPGVVELGLTTEQVTRAVAAMGYDPRTWEYPDKDHLLEACYTSVESGVPPLIMIEVNPPQPVGDRLMSGFHVLTAVGHAISPIPTTDKRLLEDVGEIYLSAEFVSSLVVHDDQNGIYLLAEFCPPADSGKARSDIILHAAKASIRAKCIGLFVPMPRRAVMPGHEATRRAATWLDQARQRHLIEKKPTVLRTFLVRSNRFKESLWHRSSMNSELRREYRELPMPRYVWVVEFAYLNDWKPGDPDSIRVFGEIIVDSTSSSETDYSYLALHLPGYLVSYRPEGHLMKLGSSGVDPDHKYPPTRLHDMP